MIHPEINVIALEIGGPMDLGSALEMVTFLRDLPQPRNDECADKIIRATTGAFLIPNDAGMELDWLLELIRDYATLVSESDTVSLPSTNQSRGTSREQAKEVQAS
jgi:hypothetical protein